MRALLVAAQVAVSMVLLICTGLLLRGLIRSQAADPGFETNKVLLISGDFGSDLGKSVALERRLVDRLQTLPGVKSAALGTTPLLGHSTPPIIIEGHGASQTKPSDRTLSSYASDTYFNTLRIPLVRGRGFTDREAASSAHVAVISESTARRFWPGENPLGKLFKLDLNFRNEFTEFEVVGVAKDVRFANLTRIDPSHIYLPTGMKDFYGILVRSEGDPQSAMSSIRVAIGALDRNLLPSLWLRSIANGPLYLQRSLARTYAMYAGMLASLALLLAAIGIYGVMAYLVNRRVAEIGVRVALGATPANVLKVIVVEGLWPACAGMAVGMIGAAALSWTLHRTLAFPGASDFFYGISFYDPITFLGLAGFFVVITAIASFVPAKRAIAVDPVVALRYN
jgi:predicted permease